MKELMIVIATCCVLFIIKGCGEQDKNYGAMPFLEMEQEHLRIGEQIEHCESNFQEKFVCINHGSIGDLQPDKAYTLKVLKDMNKNFSYNSDDYWHYNDNVYEYLKGDCEDIASTMALHMINEGIDKKYLYFGFRKIAENEYHLFLIVNTSDAGMLHLDYGNSGYPLEPNINFHLPLDFIGFAPYRWVKGNIE